MEEYFFRNELCIENKTLETAGCVQIGIANFNSANSTTLGRIFLNDFPIYQVPETARGTNANNNIIWFPLNGGERDATLYKIRFDPLLKNENRQVWIWYKVKYKVY